MLREIKRDKRGVSVLIGYALLIAFAITTSIVTYNWMKTYVPTDILDCPEDVSVLVKDITCSTVGGKYQLDLTIENTGRFDLAGYFIYASNDSEGELVTIDFTKSLTDGGNNITGAVLFLSTQENSFEISGGERSSRFVTKENITSVEITPVRFVEEDGKMKFASCGDANVKEFVRCEGEGYVGGGEESPSGCTGNGDCGGSTSYCNLTTGTCVGCLEVSHCNDGLECTIDTCLAGICSNENAVDGAGCSIGTCQSGECIEEEILPFLEDFEGVGPIMEFTSNTPVINGLSGIGYKWSYEKTNNGRLRFECDACPYESGSYAAAMDANPSAYSQNYLILELDLSDYLDSDSLALYVNYTDTADDQNYDRDSVSIRGSNSDSWDTFVRLNPAQKTDRIWSELIIDIDQKLSEVGQSVSSTFQVRLGQYDNWNIMTGPAGDGIIFDDIRITNS